MIRTYCYLLAALAVFGCSDGSSGDSGSSNSSGNIKREISGIGGTVTVDNREKTDLTVSGTNNTVNIESDIGTLYVSGINNLLNFSTDVTVDSCELSGSDNSAVKEQNVSISCDDTGLGNTGF